MSDRLHEAASAERERCGGYLRRPYCAAPHKRAQPVARSVGTAVATLGVEI